RFIAAFERVTDDLCRATIESYDPTEDSQIKAKKIATQYVESFDGTHSLLFSDDCGLGKSHLSFAITKALRQKGNKIFYIKVKYSCPVTLKKMFSKKDISNITLKSKIYLIILKSNTNQINISMTCIFLI